MKVFIFWAIRQELLSEKIIEPAPFQIGRNMDILVELDLNWNVYENSESKYAGKAANRCC